MSQAVHYERVKEHLESLKLHAALAELDPLLERSAKEERSLVDLLDELLTIERTYRFERRVAANLRLSGIPTRKTLEEFDYEAQESIPRKTRAIEVLVDTENMVTFLSSRIDGDEYPLMSASDGFFGLV